MVEMDVAEASACVRGILWATLLAVLGSGCDSDRDATPATESGFSAPSGGGAKSALAIRPAAWASQGATRARCGIVAPRDGSVLSPSAWQKLSVRIVTPGWKGRAPHDLVRIALDDFPAVTLPRKDTTARLTELSHGLTNPKPGLHTVYAYPVGEGGRHPKGAMVGVSRFWIGPPTHKLPPLQRSRHVLLSSPTGSWTVSGSSALLDVVLFGTNLADHGLQLRVSLRGAAGEASIATAKWTPLRLTGLTPGKYQLEAKLVTAKGHAGAPHQVELVVR